MAGDVERRARLARIGARGLRRRPRCGSPGPSNWRTSARRNRATLLDRGDHLQPPPLRADIVAGAHERARQQAAGARAGRSRRAARAATARGSTRPRCTGSRGSPPANSFSDGSVTVRTCAPSACSTRAASSSAAVTSGCAGMSRLMEMAHEADAQVAHAAIQHAAEIPRAASPRCRDRPDRARRSHPAAARCPPPCGSSARHGPA